MITTYLQGGLGNQMFQVACTFNLAKLNNDEAWFNFNSSHTPLQGKEAFNYKKNIFKEFIHKNTISHDSEFEQQGHCYKPIPYQKNMRIKGYFQSEKYFTEHSEEICDKFRKGLGSEKVDKWLATFKKPLVSLHVRRGDYLKFPDIHRFPGLEYYNKALENFKDCDVILISDDKLWVKENFKSGTISPFTDELDELYLMTQCEHNIIANSSFSWWGTYLNQNINKKVYYPDKWFGPRGFQDTQDTAPQNWNKICC